jgi:DNA-binding winged helix-turn-helix (wHTH) protein
VRLFAEDGPSTVGGEALETTHDGTEPAYRFGPYVLVPSERRLVRGGEPVPLAPKLFDLLLLLVRNSGRLVDRSRIVEAIWPDVFVTESNLRQKIWMLRRALEALGPADEPGMPYVETVPRQGYRFVAPVTPVSAPRPGIRWLGVAIPLALAACVAGWAASGARIVVRDAAPATTVHSVAVVGLRDLSSAPRSGGHAQALAEITRAELASGAGIRVLPAESVARATRGLALPESARLPSESLQRLRLELGADLAVIGSYLIVGRGERARVCVHLLVQHTASGEITAAAHSSGERRHLTGVMARAGADLRRSLALLPLNRGTPALRAPAG